MSTDPAPYHDTPNEEERREGHPASRRRDDRPAIP